jgi:carbonic anhydrase/acetyltransferase-like protein (isoleucine patch superfamily)
MIRSFRDKFPSIADSAYIADTAVIIGDVHVGGDSSVWFNVVIRGDVNFIRIGARTNIQDLSVLHVSGQKDQLTPGRPLIIGNDVTIGHSAIIHGCIIEDGSFIGMKAMIMDGVVVGKGAMIAAGSLVPEGTDIPAGTLWLGSPAKFKRFLTKEDSHKTAASSLSYAKLAKAYKEQALSTPTAAITD